MRSETIDVEIREIPAKELVEILKIQKAKPDSLVRYSLVPRMMLWIRQEVLNGRAGRGFPIGEKNGKWYIITLAGHTTKHSRDAEPLLSAASNPGRCAPVAIHAPRGPGR